MNNGYLKDTFFNSTDYIPSENSYIENILRLNGGKKVTVYQTYPNNKEEIFNGVIEKCGKDHFILSDPTTGDWYMLLMKYLDFIKFEEEITTMDQFYTSSSKNY